MRFIFTCGGTAGHINPAIAVAGRLAELVPGSEFLFIGAEGKMEMELVPREGYEIKALKVTNLSRGRNLKAIKHNLQSAANVIRSGIEAKKIIREFKPDIVIGTGGYVCYPVLNAAASLGIPTAVHESNAVPGLTTKMLAEKVSAVMVGFEESRQHYKNPEKVFVTGTPVRGSFSEWTKERAKEKLGLPADKPLVLSVWGSLGSGHMNEIIPNMIPLLKDGGMSFIHATGASYYDKVKALTQEIAPNCEEYGVDVRKYIYDMPVVMAAADLIMCRAGASTLAELAYMGKPAILVPSPNVTNNHQEKNARVMEKNGGAAVLLEGEFSPSSLLLKIRELVSDKEKLANMSAAMKAMSIDNACDEICNLVLSLKKAEKQ